MAADAGGASGPLFHVERAPGGWAVIHTPDGRRSVLAREEAARRLTGAGNARPDRAARVLRRLDVEANRASNRGLVALRAADELLDAAAAECFADPLAATDVVRWNHLRRLAHQTEDALERGPAAFGALRLETQAPALWNSLAEPRHQQVPAWKRFEEAARVWGEVQAGRPWTPPDRFPPAAEPPLPPRAALQPETASVPRAAGSTLPPVHAAPAGPRPRPPDRGR
jgi:hypothetical protein